MYMKKIIHFMFVCLFFFFGDKAFTQTMGVDISENIRLKTRQNGTALVLQEGDSIKIYASYKKNKAASLYATNKMGEKYIVVYNPSQQTEAKRNGFDTETIKCIVCITREDGTIIKCWDIVCGDIPKPKAMTTVIKKEN